MLRLPAAIALTFLFLMPPASAAAASYEFTYTDPEGDTFVGQPEEGFVEAPGVDITQVRTMRQGDQVVTTVSYAAALAQNLDVTVYFDIGPEQAGMSILWDDGGRAGRAELSMGNRWRGSDIQQFPVTVEKGEDTLTLRFSVSEIPHDAPCFFSTTTFSGALNRTSGETIQDTAENRDANPCHTPGDDAGTGNNPPGGGGNLTPGIAPLIGVAAAAGIAHLYRRRSA